jgi:hypothetical protein
MYSSRMSTSTVPETDTSTGSGASMRSLRGSAFACAAGILKSTAMSLRVRKAFRSFKTDERIDSRGGIEARGSRGKNAELRCRSGRDTRSGQRRAGRTNLSRISGLVQTRVFWDGPVCKWMKRRGFVD